MTKSIFTTKINPTYDDLPETKYHFPRTYLNQVRASVGDWIVYYEPRRSSGDSSSRGGRQSYIAVGRVVGIEVDYKVSDHYYALISDYLEFDRPVPFKSGVHYYESALKRPDGQTSKGAFGRAVRPLSDIEFDGILGAGFSSEEDQQQSLSGPTIEPSKIGGMEEEAAQFIFPGAERRLIETTTLRPFRDEAFRRQVRGAYANTCSMSGLKLINGGGRPEVQAAHIRPVAHLGPDSVRNGLALSGTLHWMFDRGLLSVGDDYKILTAKNVPEDAIRLLRRDRKLILPDDENLRPHPSFLRFHRDTVFKG